MRFKFYALGVAKRFNLIAKTIKLKKIIERSL